VSPGGSPGGGPVVRLPGTGLRQAAPLLRRARYEVLPTRGAEQAVLKWVPRGVTVTVTASPTKGLDQTLDVTERLIEAGYHVVPHVSARLVRDRTHFDAVVTRLVAAGVDDVFVPAGDADPPAGEFSSALDLLERLSEAGNPFGRVGITGYPESHPKIEDDVTVQAMWDKRRHATYIVSNLCFNPATLRSWIGRIRRRGVTLPLLLGLAGPVERTKLMAMAAKIGVADSARFLAGHSSAFVRLSAPHAYRPERLLGRLGPTLADPASLVEGLHIFTFNQVEQTQIWRDRLLAQAPDRSRR
jgi:methylenetetrahydrofolate reductase (NADPH)